MHQPKPLSALEILKVMPTDKSISEIYDRLSVKKNLENSIPQRGDAILWTELHRYDKFPTYWD